MCSCCVGLESFGDVVGCRSEERAHILVGDVVVESCDGYCDDADET